MARPKKNNADYFSHESEMRNDVKIKALRRKFSHTGYAAWNYLLEVLTDAEGFSIVWDELSIELYAADFDLDVAELTEIVDYCLKLGLLQQNDGMLYCENLTSSFEGLMNKRGRNSRPQGSVPAQSAPVVSASETAQKESFCDRNPIKPVVSASEMHIVEYSKEEYIKEDNSKENYSSSQVCSEEVKEQEKIFYSYFFFKNVKNPQQETQRFLAWNERNSWTGKNGKQASSLDERINLAKMWKVQDPGPRCGEKFLQSWADLYHGIKKSAPDLAAMMLDERCDGGYNHGFVFVLKCPSGLWSFIRQNMELVKSFFPWVENKGDFGLTDP